VTVFKATHVINFAQGSLLLLGAYVIARAQASIGFWPAVVIGVLAAALAAVLIDVVLIRRIRRADLGTLAILTLGVDIVLATELSRRIGTDVLSLGAPWGSHVTEFLGIRVATSRVIAGVAAAALVAGFWAAFTFTDWGIAMRSAAEDGETASLMGIRLNRVAAGAWAVSGALAAIGGAFFTSFPASGVSNSTGLLALGAIPAAVLGGLDSTVGAVVGGLIIGVAVTFAAGYQDDIAFLGRGLSEVIPYFALFVVLLWRPSGLFGTRAVTRV
jgi:branched-chain amino acid transport system permease protein